jgi:hypothetical protein
VGSAAELDVRECRWASARERHDMMEFQETSLAAPMSLVSDERTPSAIAVPHPRFTLPEYARMSNGPAGRGWSVAAFCFRQAA